MGNGACFPLICLLVCGCAPRQRGEAPPATPSKPAESKPAESKPAESKPAVDCSPPWEAYDRTKQGRAMQGEQKVKAPEIEPEPTPPPERWSEGNRNLLEVLQAVCDVVYSDVTFGERVYLGCRSCALGSTGAPPHVIAAGSGGSDRGLFNVTWGSFTRPGAEEALVTLGGCEPPADISFMTGFPGFGNALVEKRRGRYRLARYVGGMGSCKETLRRPGRKAYVCVSWDRRVDLSITLLDWNEQRVQTDILRLKEPRPTDALCDAPDQAEVGVLVFGDFDVEDRDGDGIGDVRFHGTLHAWPSDVVRAARAAPDLQAACACEKATRDWVMRVKPGCSCAAVIDNGAKTTRAIELTFLARRRAFVPTPATEATLADLRRYRIVAARSARR